MAESKTAVELRTLGILGRKILAELVCVLDDPRVRLPQRARPLVQLCLHLVQDRAHGLDQLLAVHAAFFARIPPRQEHGVLGDVPRADLGAQRHPAFHVLPVLLATPQVAIIDPSPYAAATKRLGVQLLQKAFAIGQNLRAFCLVAVDRQEHQVLGRQAGRQHQTIVVAVDHDQSPDQPRRDTPGSRPGEHLLAVLVLELDPLGLRKIQSQEVRRAGLQRFAVVHHGLDAQRRHGPGKPLASRLLAFDHRHRHPVLGKISVDIQHPRRFLPRLGFRRVRRMPLLPQKLGRPQEQASPQLPTHHVGPLVDQNRQVAVRLDPLGIHRADDRLAGGPHNQRFVQLARRHQSALRPRLQPVMRDHRAFLGKAFDVLGFLFQETHRNEQGKVGVLMPRGLEHSVQHPLHVLPDPPAPRLDDHTAADGRVFRQVGCADHLLIPLGIIFLSRRADRVLCLVCHIQSFCCRQRSGLSVTARGLQPELCRPKGNATRRHAPAYLA